MKIGEEEGKIGRSGYHHHRGWASGVYGGDTGDATWGKGDPS
jgi:hypothetical protein